ncbi:HEPN domain-containing protein [Bartonella sp. LJL80]
MDLDIPQWHEKLQHLPQNKRDELAFVLQVVLEEFAKKTSDKYSKKVNHGRIVKIVLFGSYARGDWVEDPEGGYFSDYDLLVLVNEGRFEDFVFFEKAEERLTAEWIAQERLKTPTQLIVHSQNFVDEQLAVGRPFFMDILQDGIVLYESEAQPFVKPGRMPEDAKFAEAQKNFNDYYPLSLTGLEGARSFLAKSSGDVDSYMKYAAFIAHQATEQIYVCLLLTRTLYSPKIHNLEKLRSLAETVAPELIAAWPREGRSTRRKFQKLRRAYVEARYSAQYTIKVEELEWLFERIEVLQKLVKAACEETLETKEFTVYQKSKGKGRKKRKKQLPHNTAES